MSNKRPTPDSCNDDQKSGSSGLSRRNRNAKRARLAARLAALRETTLQDLPNELIEFILVKAVTMEVKGMNLVKSAWKEKADSVVNRLRDVSEQWNRILTTNVFRKELHKALDAQRSIRLEIVDQISFRYFIIEAISFKNEILTLCVPEELNYYAIRVYNRNYHPLMWVGDVPLPGIRPKGLTACSVSNCLYIHVLNNAAQNSSVIRFAKNDGHDQYSISPLISDMPRRYDTLSVTANGSIVLSSQERSEQRTVISVYNVNGHLQYEIRLSSDVYGWFSKVIPKHNGNFVLVSTNDEWETKLTEIDMTGAVQRQHQSSLSAFRGVCNAGSFGRMLLSEQLDRIELLDSQFNVLEFAGQRKLNKDREKFFHELHYNRERNEVVTVYDKVICVFRFVEE